MIAGDGLMPRPNRIQANNKTNAVDGRVVWSPIKSLWFSAMAVTAIIGGAMTVSWSAVAVFALLTVSTLCFGHSVGLHRLLIHRSFTCPLWLEYCMVSAGMLVGMGGPRKVIRMHEMRDWAQRQSACHPFFNHGVNWFRDGLWNLHCEFQPTDAPVIEIQEVVTHSEFYRLLDRYWMAVQLPLAIALYFLGGWSWVVWGICVRITASLFGHWLVNFLAHNFGEVPWQVEGASVQGHNLIGLGLLTMGEAWHNNHHAFPESAKFGLESGQLDPGWWLLSLLKKCGCIDHLTLPQDLPHRAELKRIKKIEGCIPTTNCTQTS